ncbi:MAG: FAD-dependent oxidoreductase [Chloroflexi bacterium]|nr:FAD-dependent oxidoreductase [Chloroflexota bacterium]
MTTQPDVVVIGGGVAGLATAYFLTKSGARVLILEREAIGCGASGTAAGILSCFSESAVPPAYVQLAAASLRLHAEINPEIREETGQETLFGHTPQLRVAFDESELETLRRALAIWDCGQVQFEFVDGDTARRLEPYLAPEVVGALHARGDGQVDAYRYVLGLAAAGERRGAVVRHAQAVGLSRSNGRVTGVRLADGEIPCERVVVALGPWSDVLADWFGLPVLVEPLKGQIIRINAPEANLSHVLHWHGAYVVRKLDGLVTAGTTEERVGFDRSITEAARDTIVEGLMRLAPSLAESRVVEQTACLRPITGDGLPILGRVPGWDGAYLATGMGRKGILLSAASGRSMAELVLTGESAIDLSPFDPARFAPTPA